MTGQAGELRADGIRFERVYEAPIEDVWALWTTKDGIEAWYAPEGMHVAVSVFEPQVGGAFDYAISAVGAAQIAYLTNLNRPITVQVSGRFVEVEHCRRLRMRFDMDFVPDVAPYPYDMLVELEADGGFVRMVLTADRHPDLEMTRGALLALTTQLQRFDRAIAAARPMEQG